MSEERVQFIKEQLAAGKTADEIRRLAISHGHGTDGFEADFAAASAVSGGAAAVVPQPAQEAAAESVPEATIQTADAGAAAAVPPPVGDSASDGVPPAGGFIGAFDLIKDSFAVAKDNFRLMGGFLVAAIGMMVIGGIFLAIITATAGASLMGGGSATVPVVLGIVLYLVWLIGIIITTVALVYGLIKRREEVGYWEGVSWAFSHFWHIFWISLLMQLVISGAYLFLIIPGLVLSLYVSFALFVYISEGEKGFAALLRSTELVYGNWWGVLGRILLFVLALIAFGLGIAIIAGLFGGLLMMVDGVGLVLGLLLGLLFAAFYLFVIVWGVSLSVVMMESLQSFKPTKGMLWDSMKTTRIIYIILAVIGIPMMFVVQGLNFYGTDIGSDPGADWYLEDDSWYEESSALDAEWEAELQREIQQQIQLELEAQNQI